MKAQLDTGAPSPNFGAVSSCSRFAMMYVRDVARKEFYEALGLTHVPTTKW